MIVVDASVAVRILSQEIGAADALSRISPEDTRCAPDWIRLEVANAMARKVREGAIAEADAFAAAGGVTTLVEEQIDSFGLIDAAFSLSIKLKHPMYDCLYLALAIQESCLLITTDKKFVASAAEAAFSSSVELLA